MTDRVAIVTGGSGGIGRPTAERLARDGMAVVITYAGNKQPADEAVAGIVAGGGAAAAVRADVANEDDVAELFDTTERLYGGVDVVAHTAGIMLLAPLIELDLDALDRMHRTNIRGTFVVNREAARRVRPGGAIINFSSSVTKLALPTYTAYAASKGAVDASCAAGTSPSTPWPPDPRPPRCSWTGNRRRPWSTWPGWRPWSGSASRRTWRRSWPSSPVRPAG
jgi:3-oxoacyl-[acyl-carrier protein] reductase